MPNARKTQVSIEATPYYHCISRCVPKALRGAGSTPCFFMWKRLPIRTGL